MDGVTVNICTRWFYWFIPFQHNTASWFSLIQHTTTSWVILCPRITSWLIFLPTQESISLLFTNEKNKSSQESVRIHGIRNYNRLLNLRAGDCPNGVLYDECHKVTRKPIRSPLGTLGTEPIADAITRAVLKDMFIYNPLRPLNARII